MKSAVIAFFLWLALALNRLRGLLFTGLIVFCLGCATALSGCITATYEGTKVEVRPFKDHVDVTVDGTLRCVGKGPVLLHLPKAAP